MERQITNHRYLRVAIQSPARIVPAGGQPLPVTAIDLSLGGVQLSCDKEVAFSLLSDNHRTPGLIQGVEAMFELTLPDERKQQQRVKSRCRVVNFCRRAENLFEIGCQFLDPDEEQQFLINSYMARTASQTT